MHAGQHGFPPPNGGLIGCCVHVPRSASLEVMLATVTAKLEQSFNLATSWPPWLSGLYIQLHIPRITCSAFLAGHDWC